MQNEELKQEERKQEGLKRYLEGSQIMLLIADFGYDSSGMLSLQVAASDIVTVLNFLKENERYTFQSLMDVCGVDYPERDQRFEVVYHLLSLTSNLRIRVKLCIYESEEVPTVTHVYPSANWYEREVWDMYGINFSSNSDMRRILTDYEFEGHPMRKDFPLTGFEEVRYDNQKGKVVYEKVELMQAYRNFDFASPWTGTDYELPGDEKATEK